MIYSITLKHDFFWSAWKRYHWQEGVAGIGIILSALRPENEIIIHSKYGKYRINGGTGLAEVLKNNSSMIVKGNTKLGIIPLTAFTLLN